MSWGKKEVKFILSVIIIKKDFFYQVNASVKGKWLNKQIIFFSENLLDSEILARYQPDDRAIKKFGK